MNKKVLRTYTRNLRKISRELREKFEKYGKIISSYHTQKLEIQTNSQPKTIAKTTALLLIHDERYIENKDKLIILEDEINKLKLKIESIFQDYKTNYTNIKSYVQNFSNLSRVEKNNQRLSLIHLNKQFNKINKIILVSTNAELNEFLESKKKLEEIILNIDNVISTILHSNFSDLHYKYQVEDYSKIKKLSERDLKTGDIILNDDYETYKKSIALRQIKYFIKSTILHVAIYYGTENKRHLIYEASGRNRKVSYLGDFKKEKGTKNLVLRLPHSFTDKEKKIIKEIIENHVNKPFSIIKLYGIALNYTLLKLYKTWFPFITTGKNIYFGEGIFCSQTIGEIYQKLGINISNKEDLGMLSPIDIFNSFELDIIGYIE